MDRVEFNERGNSITMVLLSPTRRRTGGRALTMNTLFGRPDTAAGAGCGLLDAFREAHPGAELRLWLEHEEGRTCLYPGPQEAGEVWPGGSQQAIENGDGARLQLDVRGLGDDGNEHNSFLARALSQSAPPRARGALGRPRADGALRRDQSAVLHQRDPGIRAVGAGRGDANPVGGGRRAGRAPGIAVGLPRRRPQAAPGGGGRRGRADGADQRR
jgi:hypothetical protein